MYSRVTRDIEITVLPEFVPERSDEEHGQFFWAYTVEIANQGQTVVQVTHRHWKITDANGRQEEVKGKGIVGEQPVLKPGEIFRYTSGWPAADTVGLHGRKLPHGGGRRRHLRRRDPDVLARSSLQQARAQLTEPGSRAATIGLLEDLVGFDTVSSNSNLPLVERIEAYLREHGIEAVRVPNAAGDKAALFATVGPMMDGGVVLSGHTDVVPVKGQSWSADPFALRQADGKLFGRGTCDMKGFDAICLAMVPVFLKAGLKKPIHLLLSYDEEIGCLGSLDTIARFGVDLPRPAIALVGEPTEMAIVNAHKSIATYKTIVHGKEAHSANPALGASAIEAACAMIAELYRLQSQLQAEGDATRAVRAGLLDRPCRHHRGWQCP